MKAYNSISIDAELYKKLATLKSEGKIKSISSYVSNLIKQDISDLRARLETTELLAVIWGWRE